MKYTFTGLLAAALMFSGAFSAAPVEEVTLHPDLATAIRLVDEAIHVLDTVAAEVWPEWKSTRITPPPISQRPNKTSITQVSSLRSRTIDDNSIPFLGTDHEMYCND